MNTTTSQIEETVVPELMPQYVERIDENGHYVILKESRDNPGFNMSYLHEYVFHDGDILSPDEYAERIHIEFVIENLEKASSYEKIITFLEAETKERLLKAYRWGLNTLHTILLNKKQSKKFIVQQLAKGIIEWQKELDNARNHQNNIIIDADVTDIPEKLALPVSIQHNEPAPASETQEPWVKVAQELGFSWTREQFIKGRIIANEYNAYKNEPERKHKRYAVLSASGWLFRVYSTSLKSIRELATFFGVNVPDDEYHKRAIEKRSLISQRLADLIFCDMACVFVRTYIVENPPDLPPELTDHPVKTQKKNDEENQSQKVTSQPAENAPKRTRTPRKRPQITAESIYACSDENQVLALLNDLTLKELKDWAKTLKIRLEHLKGLNNKAKLSKHIAFTVIYEKELRECYAKKRIVKTGTRVTSLTEHYYSMDEKTGQISFVFC